MINLYFYLTGSITVFFAFLSWYYAKNIKSLKVNINSLTKEKEKLISENKDLKAFKERRKSKQRKAFLVWSDIYELNKPSVKWSVTFYLKEVSTSDSNPNLVQFEVESFFSNRDNETLGLQDYTEFFMKKSNGGWIDTKNFNFNQKFDWIVAESKDAIREDKLDELGIN